MTESREGAVIGAVRILVVVLVALAGLAAAPGLVRHNTWYLASDQFAFLTFADDLRNGRVFHPLGLYGVLAEPPPPAEPVDALFQTYLWAGDRLYSRYPPGFPGLLAIAGLLGGAAAQHALNPLLFLVLLAVFPSAVHAAAARSNPEVALGAAAAAAWLMLLLPSQIHLWGITVARDLPAHLFGVGSVFAALRARPVVAGCLLGLGVTVRPDAVLYGASLLAVGKGDGWKARDALAAIAGLAVTATPVFLYNFWTTGHLLRFTQGNEFDRWLSQGAHSGAVLAQVLAFPSGGGFRLTHLATSLPGNVDFLCRSVAFAAPWTALGLLLSLTRERRVARAFLPYALVALPFFSFWSRPDPRYLVGVQLAIIAFTSIGAAAASRAMANPGLPGGVRIVGVVGALSVGAAAVASATAEGAPSEAAVIAPITLGLAASVLAGAVLSLGGGGPSSRRWSAVAAGIALAAVGIARLARAGQAVEPFQRSQIEKARDSLERLVPPGALVLASERLGRPAENITHYTHARAIYPSELVLLRANPSRAVARAMAAGRRVFLLVPTSPREPERGGWGEWMIEAVDRRSGDALHDWFVDPRAAPDGATLFAVHRRTGSR